MTSSTSGDRRWASTKKGGMTVLGKVAVPKPINLPSQRLENHGMDPNVELVPKGSLSWGAQSSSSTPNAWGSSSMLPSKTEGGSPTHFSGRPSSGGGTRPSTVGSDWTSKSRPSSASGVLASSNPSLLALRPRSADTRPGSSHMSRFAESLPDSTDAHDASGFADQMGITTSSGDGFSISSRDFPTLGSEKNCESLDDNYQGRPGSSSGVPSAKTVKMDDVPDGDISRSRDVKSGMVNSWKNNGPQHAEDGRHPGMEKWHGDPHAYPNPNISPQFYENWPGGAPPNPPNGGWFRGPPGVPYGAPPMGASGGFPLEPFPYYHPQVPAPGHVNSQTVPPHSSGPRGPPSHSGDMCRPIVDPYIRPGMPIRPGFYPGYYGPPMGFWNPNEQDLAFMGVSASVPVYNRYPNQNVPEFTNSNVISSEVGTLEKVEHGSHDSQRSYSDPAEQNKGRHEKIGEKKWGHNVTANVHPRDKGNAANYSSQDNSWNEDHMEDEHLNHQKLSLQRKEASSVSLEGKIESKGPSPVKFHGGSSSRGESDTAKPPIDNVTSPRDQRLMKNIEGLKSKVRSIEKRNDFHGEESHVREEVVNSKASYSINKSNTGIRLERHYPSGILVPVATNITMQAEEKGFRTATSSLTVSRISTHKLPTIGDNGGKGRFKRQEADDWQEKGATSASPSMVLVVNAERTNTHGQQQPIEIQSTEMPLSDLEMMDNDCDDKRAKMREIAKQRALKLQKEEEERIRQQKAKAFAKLEELNRRSASQSKKNIDMVEKAPIHAEVMQKQEESHIKTKLRFGSIQPEDLGCGPSKASGAVESNVSSGVLCFQTNQDMPQGDPVLAQKQQLSAIDDVCIDDFAGSQNAQVSQNFRQKRAGYKQEHNVRSEKNLHEKPTLDPGVTMLKEAGGKDVSSSSESSIPMEFPIAVDSLVQLKKKSTRAGKKKHKADESVATSSASVQNEADASKCVTESIKLDATKSKLEVVTGKPQHARNMPRPQTRSIEKSYSNDAAVWAPVKSEYKIDTTDVSDPKEEDAGPSMLSVNAVPSSLKSKRAEMERYVPKAAIKEPAQQGINRISASVTDQSIPDSLSGRERASYQTIERPGRQVESRHAGSKPKLMQAESQFVQVLGNKSSSMMDHTNNTQTCNELHQTQNLQELPKVLAAKPAAQLGKVQSAKQDEDLAKQHSWQPGKTNQDTVVDGWKIVDEPVSSGVVSKSKDQGAFGRGKINPFKEHRGSRKPQHFDHKNHSNAGAYAEDSAKQHSWQPGETNQDTFDDGWNIVDEPVSSGVVSNSKDQGAFGRGKRNPFKEHRGSRKPQHFDHKNHSNAGAYADDYEPSQADRPNATGNNSAQWQPKNQTRVINQQVNGASVQHTVTDDGDKIFKRDALVDGVTQRKELTAKDTASSKGRTNSSNKDSVVEVESAPLRYTDGIKTEQRSSSYGPRKNGTHNGRFSKGHEFRGDPSLTAQGYRSNYAPANREKQKQNSHYEYRPVGPDNTNKRGYNTEGQSANQPAGPKLRDQGP